MVLLGNNGRFCRLGGEVLVPPIHVVELEFLESFVKTVEMVNAKSEVKSDFENFVKCWGNSTIFPETVHEACVGL